MLSQKSRMKDLLRIVMFSSMIFCLAFVFSCSESQDPIGIDNGVAESETAPEDLGCGRPSETWTFMLYIAADMCWDPLEEFAGKFASSKNLNVVCFEDSYEQPAKIWFIDSENTLVLKEELGEVNSGSEAVLSNFLEYVKKNYPAKRYIASFYGDGGGWGGACIDTDPSFAVLRMEDFRNALTKFGGVDLVFYSAPCWMGAFESAYELRGCTDVYIGSENLSHFGFWSGILEPLNETLRRHPAISSDVLGKKIIFWMRRNFHADPDAEGNEYLTMAAVKTNRLAALEASLDDLATAYLEKPEQFRTALDKAREKIVYFEETSITDLFSVMRELKAEEPEPAMKKRIDLVIRCLSEAVIAEVHNPSFKNKINGLSIFLPDEDSKSLIGYYVHPVFGLDFPVDSNWDELLAAAFPATAGAKGAPENFDADRSLQYPFPGIFGD